MIKGVRFPAAVERIKAATMPNPPKRAVNGNPLLCQNAGDRAWAMREHGVVQKGPLLYAKIDNPVLDPNMSTDRYDARMFSVFLTAVDVETLTRALFSLLVAKCIPDHMHYGGRSQEQREVEAREYFQDNLMGPLTVILMHQESGEIPAIDRSIQPSSFRIGGAKDLLVLAGSGVFNLLGPVAKVWMKFGTCFSEYGGFAAACDIERGTTPTQNFYKALAAFAENFEG